MNAVDLIRFQIQASKDATAGLLADMLDAPLVVPTPNGGNHPTWIAGHITYAEANLINHILLGKENPLVEWKSLFGKGSEPTTEADKYPALGDLLAKWNEVRVDTLKVLDTLTDDDLDKHSASPPPGREGLFGTYGKVFTMITMHPLMHRGQVADARRAARRQALSA